MRIIVGLFVACTWLAAADAKPVKHVKHAAPAKKVKAAGQKRTAAKAPEETPAPPPPPAPVVHTDRARVTQVVDDEEPAARKRKW